MTKSAKLVLVMVACLLCSCGQGTSNEAAPPRPAPEQLELLVNGPTEWDDRYAAMDDSECYEISLLPGQVDEDEHVSLHSYAYSEGKGTGHGGGNLRPGKLERLFVEEQTVFVVTTSRIHFAVSEPHTFDLKNAKGIVRPDETLRVKMLPAALVKLVIPDDSPIVSADYNVLRMDGFKLYHDFKSAKGGRGGFRMLEAGKQYRVVRLHHPEEFHIIGPFDAGTRNEVVLTPTVFGG